LPTGIARDLTEHEFHIHHDQDTAMMAHAASFLVLAVIAKFCECHEAALWALCASGAFLAITIMVFLLNLLAGQRLRL
jgi:hypothetical protein